MLTRLMPPRDERENGFTLIELLVVVAIIGILAAIAIPLFLSQRDNASGQAANAEVKNAATQIEVFYTENGFYPTDETAAPPTGAGVNWSAGVDPRYVSADGTSYTLEADAVTEDGTVICTAVWDPAAGTFDAANSTC